MARVLVVYDSRSGNTEKMAFAVAEGVKAKKAEAIVKKVGGNERRGSCRSRCDYYGVSHVLRSNVGQAEGAG